LDIFVALDSSATLLGIYICASLGVQVCQ
jgi:hypothetical protein